ncbi:MarR family winged helix-turn-helix transcriptional regulator [Nocardioides stalactiti]|uniref:MarR family winged helix-turn-helix transcriptional regulator n=1 Tax=Nocardioides stalactiti TaxID=2755356 RepID=UPI00160341DD|nr:MarR family transcriptional regulator [Nocardioides stalactiti]
MTADRGRTIESVQLTLSRLMRASASRATFARQAAAAGGVDLKQPSYDLLRVLIETGPIPMGELARRSQMDVGMATRQVAGLAEEGLVSRSPDPSDRRVTLVEPTAAGRTTTEALRRVRTRHLQSALDGWSAEDLRTLDTLLGRFLDDTFATPFQPE